MKTVGLNWFTKLITALYGGIVSNPPVGESFPDVVTNSALLGFVVAVFDLGCFFGAIITALSGDFLGRRLLISDTRLTLSSLFRMLLGCRLYTLSSKVARHVISS